MFLITSCSEIPSFFRLLRDLLADEWLSYKARANYIGAHAVLGPFLPSHHALPHPVEISPADLAERQQRIGIEALGQRLLR
jgi:hypothetical protein